MFGENFSFRREPQKLLLCVIGCLLVLTTQVPSVISEEVSSSEKEFRVGVVIPLTGDLAEYGTAIRNGFEMAVQEAEDTFSNVRFVYEDSGYDGKTAVAALQKLRASDSIDLYYLWGVSPTEAMLPIVHSQQLPVIAETTVKEATVGKPLVVRAARTGERIAMSLAAELEKRNIKEVSFIVTEIPFYLDILKHLELALNVKNISIKRKQEILPSQADFKSFLLTRSSSKNEALGVFLLPSQMITFYRQMNQMKLNTATFNADILDSETIVEQCPDNINGTFYTQVGVMGDFREKYRKQFGSDIQIGSAAQAYDVALIVRDLFGNLTTNLSPDQIIARIASISPRSGATGSFKYSETTNAGKEIRMPVSMKEVREKKLITLTDDTGF